MAGTVYNPQLPYIGGIPGGIHDGTTINIQGTPHPHHHQHMFTVNLKCGASLDPTVNTALHFNVRFNESCVVRNTCQHGSWGSEERHGGNPFQRGVPFDLAIHIKHNHIKINVNGRHFCDFNHRIPMHHINTLHIDGGVGITSVSFGGKGHGGHGHHHGHHGGGFPQPGFPPAGASFSPPGSMMPPGQPMYNPPVPLTTSIPGGLTPGKMVCLSGVPHSVCQRFTINLQCGPMTGEDIALHFDVRMQLPGDSQQVIRNACISGGWGSEERQVPYFPFQPNANFDIMILAEQGKFKIAVNNQHFAEFHHRLRPLNRINTLNASGDIRITQVRFQ